MKTTGIVRPVDGLGRIVLPIEIRRNLDIEERDLLEQFARIRGDEATRRNGQGPFAKLRERLRDL